MKNFCLFLFLSGYFLATGQESTSSNIRVIKKMESEFVTARDVYIRVPENYDEEQSYPVLYMHDGQMLFSDFETWNKQDWGANKIISQLVKDDLISDVILVGVQSLSEFRHSNYFPEKPFLSLPAKTKDSLYNSLRGNYKLFNKPINSDDYLKFLVHELKPYIDQNYSTKADRDHTFIAGSSMGGLISMYAFFEYPEVYGGALCLSSHWIGGFTQNEEMPTSFKSYLDHRKSLLEGRKLYFDTGTATLDQFYGQHQAEIDAIFQTADEQSFMSLVFEGAVHSENDWKERFHIPLKFILAK